jgi:hypothetical protein
MQIFAAVLYVFRHMYKFDFRLVINKTPNKRRPVEMRSCGERETHVFDRIYHVFHPTVVVSVKGTLHTLCRWTVFLWVKICMSVDVVLSNLKMVFIVLLLNVVCFNDILLLLLFAVRFLVLIRENGGKQWHTTPKNLPRMQRTRARLRSGSCPN